MNLETKDPKDMEVIIMNNPVLVIMAAGMEADTEVWSS